MAQDDGQGSGPTADSGMARRTLLRGLGVAGVGAAISGTGSVAEAAGPAPGPRTPAPAMPAASGQITADGVTRALAVLDDIVKKDKAATTVPGIAVAVVYDGVVRYLKGLGERQAGVVGDVDADTVFQLASVSKPLSSTVIAAALTRRLAKVDWNDTLQSLRPGFTLADAWVGQHVTVADMFAHRSGLPDHAGDLLEDLGYTGEQIISKLALYPLARFRDSYAYTNYGLTAGALAFATGTGRSWQDLAREMIFAPLGMSSSSYSFADLQASKNRAALHTLVDGQWKPDLGANNDGQAPAGGANSSVRDLSRWLTMLLAGGGYPGLPNPVVDVPGLQTIWRPVSVTQGPEELGGRTSFYGLGWNVGYEDTGELRLGHSGAFGRGASTVITVYPSKKLAIAVLTNADPRGVPEAISAEFVDIVRYGASTRDWLAFFGPIVAEPITADQTKYSKPAVSPTPARNLNAYVGTYPNRVYGDLTVTLRDGALSFTVGPAGKRFALMHYSGDEFYFQTTGENESGFSGAFFAAPRTKVLSLTINAWNRDKLGVFTRR
ncbi:serine hydrolase [Myxococcus qinghaiensis]|uniref:serine hydrolase n=1 Tax=Myxococcus qinghaiensis TaxID=2906758 RepID=UPI0020A76B93|nr:serine hydrolase [Myxococcus qinghaiensis]MCP3166421.1 serine hydrolase [Myxococcus qinghaiensis]